MKPRKDMDSAHPPRHSSISRTFEPRQATSVAMPTEESRMPGLAVADNVTGRMPDEERHTHDRLLEPRTQDESVDSDGHGNRAGSQQNLVEDQQTGRDHRTNAASPALILGSLLGIAFALAASAFKLPGAWVCLAYLVPVCTGMVTCCLQKRRRNGTPRQNTLP